MGRCIQAITSKSCVKLLPGVAGEHRTPASSECTQLCTPIGLCGQLKRVSSVPEHLTSSKKIRPVPTINPSVRATGTDIRT